MNRMDREDRLYKSALGCYLAVISLMQEYPLEAEPEVFRAYKEALREIHAEVADTREPDVLDRSCRTLTGVLRDYYVSAAELASGKTEDLRAVMSALAEAAQLLGQQRGETEGLYEPAAGDGKSYRSRANAPADHESRGQSARDRRCISKGKHPCSVGTAIATGGIQQPAGQCGATRLPGRSYRLAEQGGRRTQARAYCRVGTNGLRHHDRPGPF